MMCFCEDRQTSSSPDLLSSVRRISPSDPCVHSPADVGVTSRWWYLSGMYKPEFQCGHCTKRVNIPVSASSSAPAGKLLLEMMRRKRKEKYEAAGIASSGGGSGQDVVKSGELYRIPCNDLSSKKSLAHECIFFPRYRQGSFVNFGVHGDSILELSIEEARALQIVVLRTKVKAEKYGAAHQLNWKKVGLSTAYFKSERLSDAKMPTPRSAAAFRYLLENNKYFKHFWMLHNDILENNGTPSISSFDLFIIHRGIECAMFPVLYPETEFADTGILQTYQHESNDTSNRVVSIGRSWTRKCLSSVRVYAEQRDLSFFLYEKQIAMKFFAAHTRSQRMNVTADVMTRDSQSSAGYWEIVRDALADLVRIMLLRCFDEKNHKQLYDGVRDMRGQLWLCAFPNLFITIAPAEWTFPRPYFLDVYSNCVFAGAYLMSLHMYCLVRCVWLFLANRWGNRCFFCC